MTRIIIDGVENPQDLYNALAAVAEVFANPANYDSEEEYFSKGPRDDCNCDECRGAGTVTGQAPIPAISAAMPYIPCPQRGTHLRLTDCWACWCDVHRGACLETDVLAPEAWDVAVGELLAAAGPRHRADVPVLTEETTHVGRHHADIVHGEVIENGEAAR